MRQLFFLCIIVLFSCTRQERVTFESPIFLHQEDLYIEILNDDFIFGGMSFIDVHGPWLIICDFAMDPMIHVFNKFDGTHIASGGRRGQGPGEFITPFSFSIDRYAGQLYVFDHGKNAVIRVNIDSLVLQNRMVFEEIRFESVAWPVNEVYHLRDSLFIVIEGFADIFLRTPNNVISQAAPLIAPHPFNSVSWSLISMGFLAQKVTNPRGDRFVSATNVGGIMSIFSIEGEDLFLSTTKYFYRPVLESRYSLCFESSYFGFLDIYLTNNFIYTALFGERNPQTRPHNISVFDFEGNPIIRYNTNLPIVRLAVDEVDGFIFVETVKNGEPAIGRARLPNSIAKELIMETIDNTQQ